MSICSWLRPSRRVVSPFATWRLILIGGRAFWRVHEKPSYVAFVAEPFFRWGPKLGGKTCSNTSKCADPQQVFATGYQTQLELITQRSRVQIPPPQPLTKNWVGKGPENRFAALFFLAEPSPKQVLAPRQPAPRKTPAQTDSPVVQSPSLLLPLAFRELKCPQSWRCESGQATPGSERLGLAEDTVRKQLRRLRQTALTTKL